MTKAGEVIISKGLLPIGLLNPEDLIAIQFEGHEEPTLQFTVANPLTAQGFAKNLLKEPCHEFLSSVGRVARNGSPLTVREQIGVIEIGQGLLITEDTPSENIVLAKFSSLVVAQCKVVRPSTKPIYRPRFPYQKALATE